MNTSQALRPRSAALHWDAGDAAAAAVVQAAQQPSVFGWGVLGRPLTYLAVEAVVLFAAVLALEAAAGDGDPWALLGNRIFSALRRPFW